MNVEGPQNWGSEWCNRCNEIKKATLVPAVYMGQDCHEKNCATCGYFMKRITTGQQTLFA